MGAGLWPLLLLRVAAFLGGCCVAERTFIAEGAMRVGHTGFCSANEERTSGAEAPSLLHGLDGTAEAVLFRRTRVSGEGCAS